MVATDLASRGLDLPFVTHVVNFDFPRSVSDYLHRAGRTGRAGRSGEVISFYREKDEKIIEEMRRAHEEMVPMIVRGSAYSVKKRSQFERDQRSASQPQERVSKAAS